MQRATMVLTDVMSSVSISDMTAIKRITANLPEELLQEALAMTGKGITETLVEGLELVRRAQAFETAMSLRGKVQLDIDIEELRDRAGRRHLDLD